MAGSAPKLSVMEGISQIYRCIAIALAIDLGSTISKLGKPCLTKN